MASLVAKEGRDVAFFFAYFEREPRSRQFMDWLSKQPRWFQDRVYWATSPLRLQYLNNAIPVTVVLDRNGKLVEVIEGSIKGRENHFQETIRRALATQFTPPSVAEPPK